MNVKSLSKVLNFPEIKAFLNAYPSTERAEVLKTTLLHTIYSLKATFPSTPSLFQLKDLISNAGKIQGLEGAITSMKSKLDSMKKEIFHMETSLTKPSPEVCLNPPEPKPAISLQKSNRSYSAPHLTKAPSNWRQGDTTIFRNGFVENHPASTRNFLFRQVSPPSLRNHNYKEFLQAEDNYTTEKSQKTTGIYPEWWKALTELDVKPVKLTSKVTQHVIPKSLLKPEKKKSIEPYVWHNDIEEVAKKVSQVRFEPKTSEKSAEANFDSLDSAEAKVRFSDKKYAGWVGDFSKVVKKDTNRHGQSVSKEISYTDSSRKEHSSGYTSSSMTNYAPNSEMKHFYQGEFNRFLESKADESSGKGKIKSPYHYSLSSEEQKYSYE